MRYRVVFRSGEISGPQDFEQLRDLRDRGLIKRDTRVEDETTGQRLRADEVPGLFPSLDPGGSPNPTAGMPPDHFVIALLSAFLCCLPTGIVAVVFAVSVRGRYMSGDLAGAQSASTAAFNWTVLSVFLAITLFGLYTILVPHSSSVGVLR